ncbi:VWA domain-containing protein [soil metagenome]
MRFVQPWLLFLLIPVAFGLWATYRRTHGMAKGRKRLAFGVRFVLMALLIMALAGPESRRANTGLATVFLLDRSDSISDAERKRSEEFADDAMRALGEDDLGGVVAFGKNPLVESAANGRRSLDRVGSQTDPSATDLAAAMRLASASFPEGKGRRIVVISDGNETRGDAAGAAQAAAADGIQVDTVALGTEMGRPEASIADLEVPSDARIDQPFDLKLEVDATVNQAARVEIDRDGVLVKTLDVRLDKGTNRIVVPQKLTDDGFHRFRATLRPSQDADARNNVGMGFVNVRGRPKVLVLSGKPGKGPLAGALRKQGLVVDEGGPGDVPTRMEKLQNYEAVILNDLNASFLTDEQQKLLQGAARDAGIGLAMIGGEDSFLPGGWYGTPVAEALPVDLDIRQRKSFPSTSILIIIDASGSMGMVEDGKMKIRLAAEAAEQTVKMMSPLDRVGVAGSTDGIEFVAPMQKLTDKAKVINQVRKLYVGGGGIYIGASVQRAEKELDKETSKVRHFILLADGADSEDPQDAIMRAARMRANNITTSVIAIGDGPDVGLLKNLARAGGGRYYLATKAKQLPAIFTQDASIMSRSAIEEGAFIPKMAPGDPFLRGIDGVPPLLAYDLTDTRPLSHVAMRTGKDDPLLATWQYGLATTLAFTSDAQARWAIKWTGWDGFGAFWAQVARGIARKATDNRYQVSVRNEGGKGQVEMRAFDRLGNPVTATDAKVRVGLPGGGSKEIDVAQKGPGLYTGSFEASELGSYIVSVSEPDPRGGVRVSTSGFSVPYPPEYRLTRPNLPLLTQISDTTGGKTLTKPAEALRPLVDPGVSITELWRSFLLMALVLLPIDVAIRRIALPLGEILAKLFARMRREPVAVPAVATVDRLRVAKERVAAPNEAPVKLPLMDEPAPRREPVRPSAGVGTAQAASELLAAKRRRKGEGK